MNVKNERHQSVFSRLILCMLYQLKLDNYYWYIILLKNSLIVKLEKKKITIHFLSLSMFLICPTSQVSIRELLYEINIHFFSRCFH